MVNSYNWDFIKQFHKNSPSIQINRSKGIENKYLEHKLLLIKNKISIHDYIIKKYFEDDCEYKFVNNEFPYHVENNIEHKLLWFNPNINYIIDEKYINTLLNKLLFDKNYIYFENIDSNKSIKSIRHIHVFVNKKK
jgi:hypothetical protein